MLLRRWTFDKSKYGNNWMNVIKKGKHVRDKVCITELVTHIYEESRELFNPTKDPAKDDWSFYHDALSLMSSEKTREWMQEKGYLKHWILPELGLHQDEPGLKSYAFRPVGNSPEMMPLDDSLNKDIHEAVRRHVAATIHLIDGEDPRKFSLSTPKRGDQAYLRVIQGAPTSERIIQDCLRFLENIRKIHDAQGVMISPREGRRKDNVVGENWGGHRQKKPDSEFKGAWLHPDALSALMERANFTVEQMMESTESQEGDQEDVEQEDSDGHDGDDDRSNGGSHVVEAASGSEEGDENNEGTEEGMNANNFGGDQRGAQLHPNDFLEGVFSDDEVSSISD